MGGGDGPTGFECERSKEEDTVGDGRFDKGGFCGVERAGYRHGGSKLRSKKGDGRGGITPRGARWTAVGGCGNATRPSSSNHNL